MSAQIRLRGVHNVDFLVERRNYESRLAILGMHHIKVNGESNEAILLDICQTVHLCQ